MPRGVARYGTTLGRAPAVGGRVLVVDHYDSYTASLVDLVARVSGAEPVVVQHDRVDVEELLAADFTHVVLSPGPGNPDDPRDFSVGTELLTRATVPVLGVCLGHQGIVSAFGGSVDRVPPAHGVVSDVLHDGSPLFRDVPATFRAVRYHSLAAVTVPSCLRVTAWAEDTDGGRVVMAVEHEHRPIFGVQFHPESVLTEHGVRIVANFLGATAAVPERTPRALTCGTPSPDVEASRAPAVSRLAWVEPAAFFRSHVSGRARAFWLDGEGRSEPGRRYSYLGWLRDDEPSLTFDAGTATVLEHCDNLTTVAGTDIFEALRRRSEGEQPAPPPLGVPFAGGWVGYLGYACRGDLPAQTDGALESAPDACLLRVRRFLAFDHDEHAVYAVSSDPEPSSWFREAERLLATTGRTKRESGVVAADEVDDVSRDAYASAFREVREALLAGDTYETNLTYRVRLRAQVDPVEAFSRIRALGPTPYASLLRHDALSVVSASPECFLRIDGDRWAESRPIKGTAPRGRTPETDARLRESLACDARFVAENLMVTDLVRHDLATVCEHGTVEVPELMQVESYSNVHQLVTTVRGRLRPEVTAVDAIAGLFPPASMTGAPKRRTMELIERVESSPRGVYSGALGWIGVDGRADLGVVIRTLVVLGDRVEIGTGGAVTTHSEVHAEYDETRWKIAHLISAVLGPRRPDPSAPAAVSAIAAASMEGPASRGSSGVDTPGTRRASLRLAQR